MAVQPRAVVVALSNTKLSNAYFISLGTPRQALDLPRLVPIIMFLSYRTLNKHSTLPNRPHLTKEVKSQKYSEFQCKLG